MNSASISGLIVGIRYEEPLRDRLILQVDCDMITVEAIVNKTNDYQIGQKVSLQGRICGGSRILCSNDEG